MKRIISFTFAVCLTGMLLTTSCSHQKDKERLAKIDSLSLMLFNTEKMLSEINNDSINLMLNDVKAKNEAIAPVAHTKLNMKERSDYFQLAGIEKQLKGYINDHIKNVEELNYSRKQLSDLRDDVKKHAIKGKKFDEYYQSENTSVNNLFNMVKSSLYRAKFTIDKYKFFNPVITKLMIEKKIKVMDEAAKKQEKEAEGEDDD